MRFALQCAAAALASLVLPVANSVWIRSTLSGRPLVNADGSIDDAPERAAMLFLMVSPLPVAAIESRLAAGAWPLLLNSHRKSYRTGSARRVVQQLLVADPDGYLVRLSQLASVESAPGSRSPRHGQSVVPSVSREREARP